MTANTVNTSEKMDSLERILLAATQLFAEQGFEGVTTRQIAAAANLNMATMHHHVGTKRQLYERVLARLFEEERAVINPFLEQIDDSTLKNAESLRVLLSDLVDTLVNLIDRSPARARLYMRRWLEDAEFSGEDHQRETLALYETLSTLLNNAQQAGTIRDDINTDLILRGFDWLLNGYFVTGPLGTSTLQGNPHDENNIAAFKRYLNLYVCSMLKLQP